MSPVPRYVLFPDLVIHGPEGAPSSQLVVENPVFGTRVRATSDLRVVLEWFRRPHELASIRRSYEVPPSLLGALVDAYVLIPEEDVEVLRWGLLSKAAPSIGRPISITELAAAGVEGGFAIFGAAVDLVGFEGTRGGPAAIRRAFPAAARPAIGGENPYRVVDLDLRRVYRDAHRLRCYDIGDIHCLGDSLENVGKRIERVVGAVRERGLTPVMLGGDHSVTRYVLRALAAEVDRLAVIHFDAHHDVYPVSPLRLTHGNFLDFALREERIERVLQVGLRTLERFDERLELVRDGRLVCVTSREAESGPAAEVFAAVPEAVPCYVTFDVDVLAPEVAPETGTPVPGGLSFARGLELIDHVAREVPVVGADFVEVLDRGGVNRAAAAAGRYLAQLLLGRLPFEPLESYYARPGLRGDAPAL